MEVFQYIDILPEDHVRIVEVLPGSADDAIHCNLTSEPRQDAENTYDAISYVWGDPNKTSNIICCGKVLPITINLQNALKTIRNKNPNSSHRLWADAICINQQSNEEKSHQVKQMGQIYQGAKKVFAWLGLDEDGIAISCFDLIRKWTEYLDGQFLQYQHTHNIPSFEPPGFAHNGLDRGILLKRLMSCEWFTRVWVVQEAGLAKECLLLWGDQCMDFAELIEFACFCDGRTSITSLMGGIDHGLDFWRVVFSCVYRTYIVQHSWKSSKPLIQSLYEKRRSRRGLFLDVLQIGKELSAANPRDHIYAFLGNSLAVTDEGHLILEPDYDKTEDEVYFDIFCALLGDKDEAPYVFGFVQHHSADEVVGRTGPSWLPRWRKPESKPVLFFTIGNIGLYHKAGGGIDKLDFHVSHNIGADMVLTIKGLIFDTIIWTSEKLQTDNFSLNPEKWDHGLRKSKQVYIEKLWSEVRSASQNLHHHEGSKNNTGYSDAFGLTLVTGYDKHRAVNAQEHRKVFRSYLEILKTSLNTKSEVSILPVAEKKACNASRYEVLTRNCSNRRFAITKHGRYALVPQFAEPGDICSVFLGMVTPFILRSAHKCNETGAELYHLVGESYVHGVMSGELIKEQTEGVDGTTDITLL